MSETLLSSRNLALELYEILDVEALTQRPRFAEHSRETFDAVLGIARNLAEKLFAPRSHKDGEYGSFYENGSATLIPEVKPTADAFLDVGFLNATRSSEQGDMQLPTLLPQTYFAHFQAASVGSLAYSFLTMGAVNLIESFGSEGQKQRSLQPMIEDRFLGTMAFIEPHAGSFLSDIRICAEPVADGSYRTEGNKIFIFGGDYPLSENIVYMVLAKPSDAPPGVRGTSLFIVLKFPVNADGSLGSRNDVIFVGLSHKMGYCGTTSTALNFGDNGACVGYPAGKPYYSLAHMFQMMNEARIGVGMGAAMLGYVGYPYSLEYARERPQGRLPDDKDPSAPQVAIIRHVDVRCMLLTQKAYVEGAFDLGLYAACLLGNSQTLEDDGQCRQAHELLDLLTPIIKSWSSEFCLKANRLATQILGGHGYTREHPVKQHYRDNRLNPIHEGTHGIQPLDLLECKAGQNNGADLCQLTRLTQDACRRTEVHPSLAAPRQSLERLVARLSEVTLAPFGDLMQSQVNWGLANSALYLKVFGHVVIGQRWLERAIRAEEGLARGDCADAGFYRGKLQVARYFLIWEVSGCHHELTLLEARDDVRLSMQEEWF